MEELSGEVAASRTASGIPLKDPDSIKLFVGQVPRTMQEDDLKPIFSEYGQLYELLVLRDKASGTHKGCAFVTFCSLESAENAQRGLHGNKVLPGMTRPIQVKPANADDTAKLDRKLFIGMISKQATEDDVVSMFSPFGEVEEQSILKDSSGTSKGCAFIKYKSAKDCHKAIRSMHHSLTMQGCSSPLVVKWADTDKERVVRRHHKLTTDPPTLQPTVIGNRVGQTHNLVPRSGGYNMMTQQSQQLVNNMAPQPTCNNNNGAALLAAITPLLHNLASQSNPETNKALVNALIAALQALANCNNTTGNSHALTDIANLLNATVSGNTTNDMSNNMLQPPAPPQYKDMSAPYNQVTTNTSTSPSSLQFSSLNPSYMNNPVGGIPAVPVHKQSEGPDGANLFIYHIPPELRDNDLCDMFNTFGNIVSCKIFIDKATNQSKCFGFVSYDNPNSAQQAINAMHGFKIGSKRLKVQLKKSKDAAKPF